MADEPRLIGTRRTPSEQDLFDRYMLSFITVRDYLEGLDALAEARKNVLSPDASKPEGSSGSRTRE